MKKVLKNTSGAGKAEAEYAVILSTAEKIIRGDKVAKADLAAARYSAGEYAVKLCRRFADWEEYTALFDRLKADLKKNGLKFAGTPLHKVCLAVSTAVIDGGLKIEVSGDSDELAFTAVKTAFKNHGVALTATQSKVRLAFGVGTAEDGAAEVAAKFEKAAAYIDWLAENASFIKSGDADKLIGALESRFKPAAVAEKAA